MMHLAGKPDDFQDQLRSVAGLPAEARLAELTRLAAYRLDLVDTMQLDRLLCETESGELPSVRVAILAPHTTQHLLPGIRVAGLRSGLAIETYINQYGQYRQEILDRTSQFHAFEPQVVLTTVGAAEVVAGLDITADAASSEDALARKLEEVRDLWRLVREGTGASIVQQTVLDSSEPVFGSFDRLVPAAPLRLLRRFNDLLAGSAAEAGVALLDLESACLRDGRDYWHDRQRWLQAKYEISPNAGPAYGELLAGIVAAQRGRSRKCLVLDLDNTLWGGVVGDDGVAGLALGQGDAAGEAFLAIQTYALQLRSRGIVLAICSKNDPRVAERAFAEHPEMLLDRQHIAVFKANWDDKSENIRAIADELNIGLDSLVFVDDNPAERQRVRASLPMVAVPELPDDPSEYVPTIARAGYFEALSFTSDDRARAEQYRNQGQRAALQASSQSLDGFLQSLDMRLAFGEPGAADLPRTAQLLGKTNQFNMTGLRPTQGQIEDLIAGGKVRVLVFRLADRFGDNGLVSALVLESGDDDGAGADILNWVMSCRVFGRQLEDEIMNIVVELANARNWPTISARFVPTDRNAVVGELYERLGFSKVSATSAETDASSWRLTTGDYQARHTHIDRGSRQ